jgi:MFS family permease
MLVGFLALGLEAFQAHVPAWLAALGIGESWVAALTAHSSWRLLMLLGAVPALLTFFIQWFVPESERWRHEQKRGTTSNWVAHDLFGVGVGAVCALAMIYLWTKEDLPLPIRIGGSVLGLSGVTLGYLYPAWRYLQRAARTSLQPNHGWRFTLKRMLLGACLSGVALLGTWASMQWAPSWADQLAGKAYPNAKAYTQISMSVGAIVGTLLAAQLGDWFGRRTAYSLLCLSSLGAALAFFRLNHEFGASFLTTAFLAGGLTASFYGWLPLYLPELFHTGVRATGQGFSFNFGRIIAAVGALQTANLMRLFGGSYPQACSVMSLIYVVGLVLIWLAPETRGQPLPE